MTFNELVEFLSIKIGHEPSDRRRRTRSVIISACSPFVEPDYEVDFLNPTIRLAHKSIGEFLAQDPSTMDFVTENCYKFFVNYKQGHTEIGRRCLTYLNYDRYAEFENFDLDEDTPDHGLLKYASIFWHQHIREAGPSISLYREVRDLLRAPNMWTCIRVQSKYAPHMFAKLVSYQGKEHKYYMHVPKSNPIASSLTIQEFYADALPPWMAEFESQGDHLNWGYHMLVREWGEVFIKYPDKIQNYFSKILGPRSFWSSSDPDNDIQVLTMDDPINVHDVLCRYEAKDSCIPIWQAQIVDRRPPIPNNDTRELYINDTLSEYPGDWNFHHCATAEQENVLATVYRYRLKPGSAPIDDSDSDSDSDNETSEEEAVPTIAYESAIWFLSVTDDSGELRWFHYKAKSGVLQKSTSIFIPQSPWLLWAHDESSLIFVNYRTWETSKTPFPLGKSALMLISHGISYSSMFRRDYTD